MKAKRPIDEREISYINGVLYLTASLAVIRTLLSMVGGGLYVDAVMLVFLLPLFLKKGSKVAWALSTLLSGIYAIGSFIKAFSGDTSFKFGPGTITAHWLPIAAVYLIMGIVWLPSLYWLIFRQFGTSSRGKNQEPIQLPETTRGK